MRQDKTLHGLMVTSILLLMLTSTAMAERRTALVIGNAAYKVGPLRNPVNDANDIATALRQIGFEVTLLLDATHQRMEEAVEAFSRQLRQGGVGLVFYSGHGLQVDGLNYLVPIDARLEKASDVKFQTVAAEWVLASMEDARNPLNILILDACRNNPFTRHWRSTQRGLAPMQAARGSLIAYATAPGSVTPDAGGNGRNGLYTSHLLQHLTTPGMSIEQFFKKVRAGVVRETRDEQRPWESSSLVGDFSFVPQTASPYPAAEVAQLQKSLKDQQAEMTRLRQELAIKEQRLQELKTLVEQRAKEVKEAQAEIKTLQGRIAPHTLEAKVAELQAALQEQQVAQTTQAMEAAQLRQKLETTEKQRQELEARLRQLTAEAAQAQTEQGQGASLVSSGPETQIDQLVKCDNGTVPGTHNLAIFPLYFTAREENAFIKVALEALEESLDKGKIKLCIPVFYYDYFKKYNATIDNKITARSISGLWITNTAINSSGAKPNVESVLKIGESLNVDIVIMLSLYIVEGTDYIDVFLINIKNKNNKNKVYYNKGLTQTFCGTRDQISRGVCGPDDEGPRLIKKLVQTTLADYEKDNR